MTDRVKLTIKGKTVDLPVIQGTEGEKAIDISQLRKLTGYVVMDPGMANSASCTSSITYMDGEKGILRYRGIPVEELAEKSTFVETAYLLVEGKLPTREQLNRYSVLLTTIPWCTRTCRVFTRNSARLHPMGILSSMVNALRSFYPELEGLSQSEEVNITVTRCCPRSGPWRPCPTRFQGATRWSIPARTCATAQTF